MGPPPGRGCYWDEHELEHMKLERRLLRPTWEWADLDGERLVWAEEGQLKRAAFDGSELGEPQVLFDFNDLRFERRVAPY